MEATQAEVVEETEAQPETPIGIQVEVEDTGCLSSPASSDYSNIFSVPTDDNVGKYL